MLDEPEGAVRDDVVVAVVGELVVRDEPQPVRRCRCASSSIGSSPRSRATRRSSSLIALAIHVTSWWAISPRSAVTSPPPPRRTIRSPFASRPKKSGPRFETTISLRRSLIAANAIRAAAAPRNRAVLSLLLRQRSCGRAGARHAVGRVAGQHEREARRARRRTRARAGRPSAPRARSRSRGRARCPRRPTGRAGRSGRRRAPAPRARFPGPSSATRQPRRRARRRSRRR